MPNKIYTTLMFLVTFTGLSLSLIQIYATPNDIPSIIVSSYYYLTTSFLLLLLGTLIQNPITILLKWITNFILSSFAIFGIILSLIAIYATPNDTPVPYAASIFYISAMIGIATIPIIKVSTLNIKYELGKLHKAFRIFILIIIILAMLQFIFNIMNAVMILIPNI